MPKIDIHTRELISKLLFGSLFAAHGYAPLRFA